MTHIYISVHPVSHRLEWRGWGEGTTYTLTSVDKDNMVLIRYD